MGATEAETKSAKISSGVGASASLRALHREADLSDALDVLDSVTVTIGKETFYPQKFNGFEVGPISVGIRLRGGESPADAYSRARAIAAKMFEAEFELRREEFFEHLSSTDDPKKSR